LGFRKISWLAERLLASQEGFWVVELITIARFCSKCGQLHFIGRSDGAIACDPLLQLVAKLWNGSLAMLFDISPRNILQSKTANLFHTLLKQTTSS
jgi:hypothetical protein